MAISEVAVKNATMLAIDEINAAGGVMGHRIVPVVEDGASDTGDFRRDGPQADSGRQGGDGLWRLDLSEP